MYNLHLHLSHNTLVTVPKIVQEHLPRAVILVLNTSTVTSVDDGLLRTSTGCTGPLSSLMLYVE